jgi:hypothetical protein
VAVHILLLCYCSIVVFGVVVNNMFLVTLATQKKKKLWAQSCMTRMSGEQVDRHYIPTVSIYFFSKPFIMVIVFFFILIRRRMH